MSMIETYEDYLARAYPACALYLRCKDGLGGVATAQMVDVKGRRTFTFGAALDTTTTPFAIAPAAGSVTAGEDQGLGLDIIIPADKSFLAYFVADNMDEAGANVLLGDTVTDTFSLNLSEGGTPTLQQDGSTVATWGSAWGAATICGAVGYDRANQLITQDQASAVAESQLASDSTSDLGEIIFTPTNPVLLPFMGIQLEEDAGHASPINLFSLVLFIMDPSTYPTEISNSGGATGGPMSIFSETARAGTKVLPEAWTAYKA